MQLDENSKTALVCAQDITERKQAEVELRQHQDALRQQAALTDLSHDAIITADQNRVITGWNTGARESSGPACPAACSRRAGGLSSVLRLQQPWFRSAGLASPFLGT
jgi:PAS domain-containing protein